MIHQIMTTELHLMFYTILSYKMTISTFETIENRVQSTEYAYNNKLGIFFKRSYAMLNHRGICIE